MKNRSLPAQVVSGLLLAVVTLALTACNRLYVFPANNFAGRPIPPSQILQRVLAAYTVNGAQGGLEILDGLRDIRTNIQDTIPAFTISGFSAAEPVQIINYPEQLTGYVRSFTDGTLQQINYGAEKSNGAFPSSFGFANSPSAAATTAGTRFAEAAETIGILQVSDSGATYNLNLPNVDKVAIDPGNTIILAMVRNSNSLYRVVKLAASVNPVNPPGAIDCQPLLLPVYCVVPVPGTYDRPVDASFSLDASSVYILNCGPECGGQQSSVTVLSAAALAADTPPTSSTYPSPLQNISVPNPIPVPGGVTTALSDGTTLYLAGQSLQGNGLFGGNLSLLNLANYTLQPTTYSISDGTHSRMLFADNNTLWIGSQSCANGPRAALATSGGLTQAANYNCLTRFVTGGNTVLPSWTAGTNYTIGQKVSDGTNVEYALTAGTSGGSAPTWQTGIDQGTTDGGVTWVNLGAVSPVEIVPAVTPNNKTNTNITVQYVNTNLNEMYYGDLNGICWVQNYNKVYSAYGGQIHAFSTVDDSEIDNSLITVQGTVLDVAYMDALTNSAN
ncbi:hypothetical protein [Granulicella mallensis]|uniref:Uncharacterized protein n=1 Tax=Granulicella mallensis TaxID=940614 RepID=A0A7W7ZKQ8_9BACT|nr:hypothetical protein [Granulicella mallensis]MBB5061735.1 hypothetical protein [Granulicella mallensis]